MTIYMKKATAVIQLGYNTLVGFTGVAIFVALSSKHFAEAAALAALLIVILVNADIERCMAFGPRACLPKTNNELAFEPNEQEMTAITGNYALTLIFYLGWAVIALLVAKNIVATILCFAQAKLVIERHKTSPNRYVVGISHTIPPIIFMLLLPQGMMLAKIQAVCGSILLFCQSAIAIYTLEKADRDVKKYLSRGLETEKSD